MFVLLSTVIFKNKRCKKTSLPFSRQGCFVWLLSHCHKAECLITAKEGIPAKATLGPPSFVPSNTSELFLDCTDRDAAREVFLEHDEDDKHRYGGHRSPGHFVGKVRIEILHQGGHPDHQRLHGCRDGASFMTAADYSASFLISLSVSALLYIRTSSKLPLK